MSNISYYQNLIQEKRKKTPFRDFVRELGSWSAFNLYKVGGHISRYPDTGRIKNLDDEKYKNASSYFHEYDESKDFFTNLQEFYDTFPFEYLFRFTNNENSDFGDTIFGAKNTYLSFVVGFSAEDVAYSALCYDNIHNVYNSFLACTNCSNIYMSGGVNTSHNIFYSRYITSSSDIWFSTNLINCHECIGCDGLENQKYMIGNIQYIEEEFRRKKAEILNDKKSFEKIYQHVRTKQGTNFASERVEGDYIIKSSNIESGGWLVNIHDSRNILIANGGNGGRNFYDGLDVGMNSEHFYAVMGAGGPKGASHLYCSIQITESSFIYYSGYLIDCHHCLGCLGLKNKSYCILNKQYTKEEWELLTEKIFASMESDGTLGEFFPASMNPFYFNDTLAYLIDDSFTQEEIEAEGYLWRGKPIRADIPEGMRVVKNTELDQFQWFHEGSFMKGAVEEVRRDGGFSVSNNSDEEILRPSDTSFQKKANWYIDPEIMNVVITDEQGNYYRIVQMEYDFLMKHALPLPTMHWLERMKMGFSHL